MNEKHNKTPPDPVVPGVFFSIFVLLLQITLNFSTAPFYLEQNAIFILNFHYIPGVRMIDCVQLYSPF